MPSTKKPYKHLRAGGNGEVFRLCASESAWHWNDQLARACTREREVRAHIVRKSGELRRWCDARIQHVRAGCAGTESEWVRESECIKRKRSRRAMMGSLSRKRRDVSLRVDSAPSTSLLRWPFALHRASIYFSECENCLCERRARECQSEMHPAGALFLLLVWGGNKNKTQGAKLVRKPQYPLSALKKISNTCCSFLFLSTPRAPSTFPQFLKVWWPRTNEGRHLEKMSRTQCARAGNFRPKRRIAHMGSKIL